MIIRLMNLYDYQEVYALWEKTNGVGIRSLDDSEDGVHKFLKRNPFTCFVSIVDERIVGVIMCGHDGRRGYIYHLAVDVLYRKNGIGKALVSSAIESLKKEKINKVALVVLEKNDVGNKFWDSQGFVKREDLIYRNISLNKLNG